MKPYITIFILTLSFSLISASTDYDEGIDKLLTKLPS